MEGVDGGCVDLHDADVAECSYYERHDADVEEDDGCDVESDAGLLFEGDDDGAAGETHYVLRLKGIRGHQARRGRILPLRFMR